MTEAPPNPLMIAAPRALLVAAMFVLLAWGDHDFAFPAGAWPWIVGTSLAVGVVFAGVGVYMVRDPNDTRRIAVSALLGGLGGALAALHFDVSRTAPAIRFDESGDGLWIVTTLVLAVLFALKARRVVV